MSMKKRKVNKKVVIMSIFGLICLVLAYSIHWIFALGCAIAIWVNQKEILGN